MKEAAALSRVSIGTVLKWIDDGWNGRRLKSFRVGCRRWIFEADLEDFLRAGFRE